MFGSIKYLAIIMLASLVSSHVLAQEPLVNSGNIDITQEDIAHYILENIPSDKREAVLGRNDIFKEMAESIYIIRSLASEAEAAPGFDSAQAAWSAQIKYQRAVVSAYRRDYVRKMLQGADWEAAAHEVYMVESERFTSSEQVRASHILVSTEQRSDEDALKLASELHARINNGEDFSTLAGEFTDDPAGKKNGGDLGFFERGKMVKPFGDAVFAMQKEGEISEPVKTPFGYHVIRFSERKIAKPIPFDKVKDQIISEIQTKRGDQVWQDKIIATRSVAKQSLNEAGLEELRSTYQGYITTE